MLVALSLALSLILMPLPMTGVAQARPAGDITIVVQDQDGNPIEGAVADIFWDNPALKWMGGRTADASGRAAFMADEIAKWRSNNGNPTQFQVWAKYETEHSYGCVYTWTTSDEIPGITYDEAREYTFDYNLVMFVKQVKGMMVSSETHADGSITAIYVLAHDISETSLSPKMGFFCSWDTGATNPPENPIVIYFAEGKYVLLNSYLNAEISPRIDSAESHFLGATGDASLFKDMERDSDKVIAIPAIIKMPVTHEGLTDSERDAVEDYYTVVAGQPRPFIALTPSKAPFDWGFIGGIVVAPIVVIALLIYFLVIRRKHSE